MIISCLLLIGMLVVPMISANAFTDWFTDLFNIGDDSDLEGELANLGPGGEDYIAYFPFDGNANDESGNGNHGTVKGATLTEGKDGNDDSAYFFNNNDYINLGNRDFLDNVVDFTLSTWLYHTSLTQDNDIFTIGLHYRKRPLVIWRDEAKSDHYAFLVTDSEGDYSGVKYTNYIPKINEWTHFVLVFKGNDKAEVYINGIKDSSFDMTDIDNVVGNSDLYTIGNDNSHRTLKSFDGKIDEIKIYDRALSEIEINELYSEEPSVLECAQDSDCDDGLYCNGIETCSNGFCIEGIDSCQEDSYSCTIVSCNEVMDICETEYDNNTCNDNNTCTDDSCIGTNGDVDGCFYSFNINVCDDSMSCTKNDICDLGTCFGTPNDDSCSLPLKNCTSCDYDPLVNCIYLPEECDVLYDNDLKVYIPFNGDIDDESGNENNGEVYIDFSGDVFRGLWYADSKTGYGGPMSTYTAKHRPLAIYREEVNKTFFVYGGRTPGVSNGISYISYYDHENKIFITPIEIGRFKDNDAHRNPVLLIDEFGYIYVFWGSHNDKTYVKRSVNPYDISSWVPKATLTGETTYPQAWQLRLDEIIVLYRNKNGWGYKKSINNATTWNNEIQLIKYINDDLKPYLISIPNNEAPIKKLHLAWTMRDWSKINVRTNIYYMYSNDGGSTWKNIKGNILSMPINENNADDVLVFDSKKDNTNMKDIKLDSQGNPYILFLQTESKTIFRWKIAKWNSGEWIINNITISDHSFDSGEMIFFSDNDLRAYLPSGVVEVNEDGGEIQEWTSINKGDTWINTQDITTGSKFSHNYVRAVIDSTPDFRIFWAYGSSSAFSLVDLYFWGENQPSAQQIMLRERSFYSEGIDDKSISLSNKNEYVQISTNELSVSAGTLSLWAFPKKFDGTNSYIFGHTTIPAWKNRIQLYVDDSKGLLNLGLGDSHTKKINIYDLDIDKWYHIVLTWDGTDYKVYINGNLEASGTYSGLSTFNSIADVGNNGNPADRSEGFNGLIDELKIYNKTLTEQEIQVLYNSIQISSSEQEDTSTIKNLLNNFYNFVLNTIFKTERTELSTDNVIYNSERANNSFDK